MPINNELKELINQIKYSKNITQSEIADKIGVKQSYLSDVINGRAPFSSNLKNKIYEVFSDLFNELENTDRIIDRFDIYMKEKGLNDNRVTEDLKLSNGIIGKSRKEGRDLSTRVIERILNHYPDLNHVWLITGEGSMLNTFVDENGDPVETKPRLPVNARGGSPNGFGDPVMLSECQQLPVITQFPPYDFTMFVTGDSMMPDFVPGDEIAIKRVHEIIEWGSVYVLDTEDGAILKRIYDEADNFRCVSINPLHKEFTVRKTSVYGVYRVVGLLRYIKS